MRSEQQMLDMILEIASQDERIRAVVMNGSRANPNAPKDIFQDFDSLYIVMDAEPFKRNLEWIKRFREMMILQLPDDMQDPPPAAEDEGSYGYLMQFADGNRIDLGIVPIELYLTQPRDSLSILLLDKDGKIGPFPAPTESDYLPNPPTAKAFADCCNEFWWVSAYVAKGLWRQEILYAKHMLDCVVREQLMKMLNWHIGMHTNFQINPGKMGKYFQTYLEPELWTQLQGTFADASYENTWNALFAMCDLFRKIAIPVAEQFSCEYPFDDDRRVSAHLEHIRTLPRNARQVYS